MSRGALPAGMNVQVPGAPCVLQDMHLSVQAVLQQTPSTQKPLPHSLAQPQESPGFFVPPASALHWIFMSTDPSFGFDPPPDEQPAMASPIARAATSIARRRRVDELGDSTPRPWGSPCPRQAGENLPVTLPIPRVYHVVRFRKSRLLTAVCFFSTLRDETDGRNGGRSGFRLHLRGSEAYNM